MCQVSCRLKALDKPRLRFGATQSDTPPVALQGHIKVLPYVVASKAARRVMFTACFRVIFFYSVVPLCFSRRMLRSVHGVSVVVFAVGAQWMPKPRREKNLGLPKEKGRALT